LLRRTNIRTPDLINTGKLFIFNQIGVYFIIMTAIGGGDISAFDSGLDPHMVHHFKYPLVINIGIFAM